MYDKRLERGWRIVAWMTVAGCIIIVSTGIYGLFALLSYIGIWQ